MCQAYAAEAAGIRYSEARATVKGFLHGYAGKPDKNPFDGPWDKYEKEAWQHGYNCAMQKFLPWSVKSQLRKFDKVEFMDGPSTERYKRTGKLPVAFLRSVY